MLKNVQAFSGFSVPDLARAKEFYGEVLGLAVEERPEGLELTFKSGMHVFVYHSLVNKPADFTILNFIVGDIEAEVDELNKKGVMMEQYDMKEIKTDRKGIVYNESGVGPRAMAWFKDPAGNIIGLIQE
jgi:predicted enzyme related to lactoylglutathione lyase